jgi:hypothetical protein
LKEDLVSVEGQSRTMAALQDVVEESGHEVLAAAEMLRAKEQLVG